MNDLPSDKEVLAVIWKLLKSASDGGEAQDLPAAAKLAELLLKHGKADSKVKKLDPEFVKAIEEAT